MAAELTTNRYKCQMHVSLTFFRWVGSHKCCVFLLDVIFLEVCGLFFKKTSVFNSKLVQIWYIFMHYTKKNATFSFLAKNSIQSNVKASFQHI